MIKLAARSQFEQLFHPIMEQVASKLHEEPPPPIVGFGESCLEAQRRRRVRGVSVSKSGIDLLSSTRSSSVKPSSSSKSSVSASNLRFVQTCGLPQALQWRGSS